MKKTGFAKKLLSAALSFSMVFACTGSLTFGAVTDTIPGTTKTTSDFNASFFSVTGFAEGHVNDRTEYIGTDKYAVVTNEAEFLQALDGAKKGNIKVIEIANDLDLGYDNIPEEVKALGGLAEYASNTSEVITNPGIIESGLSQLIIGDVHGLTIFSRGGATISRAEWKLQGTSSDIIVRNINFDSLWHWTDDNNTKASGWTPMKVNGAKGVWFDHCTFTLGSDGLADSENGTENLTYTWCTFGMETTKTPDKRSALYQTVSYMEHLYNKGEADTNGRYYKMRKGGASFEDILAYEAFHSKAFLIGSGDKDFKDSEGLQDGNQRLEVTMAYSKMNNLGQRVVRMRQGKGHLFNCYVDNMAHHKLASQISAIGSYGGWGINRCIDVHCGGSVAADTCVFNGVNQVIIGSEMNGAGNDYGTYFKNAYNYAMVVNSTVTQTNGKTYTGSSWDNDGNNLFYNDYGWSDRSTLGKFCWNTTIVGVEDMSREKPPTPVTPWTFNYDFDYKLPYEYQMVKLEDVEEVVDTHAGAYAYVEEPEFWLRTKYDATESYKTAAEKETIAVTDLILNHETRKISLDETAQIITKVVPSYATDRELNYTSSNPDVVEVLDSGLIIGKAYGDATITVTASNGVSKTMDVTVFQAVQELKLSSKSKTIYTGEDFVLTATVEPENANQEVIWKSSNESVATVVDGLVHPVAPGKTNITCVSAEDSSISAKCTITVKEGTATPVPTEPPVGLMGDVDADGSVTAADALLVLKHAAKLETLTAEQLAVADMDENASYDASDALIILKIAAKLV